MGLNALLSALLRHNLCEIGVGGGVPQTEMWWWAGVNFE